MMIHNLKEEDKMKEDIFFGYHDDYEVKRTFSKKLQKRPKNLTVGKT